MKRVYQGQMTLRTRFAALAVAVCLSHPAALWAQDADPLRDLVDALAARARLLDNYGPSAVSTMLDEARRDPEMVEMEGECPGTLDIMGQAAMPTLVKSQERAVDQYRTALLDLFAGKLSPEIARSAADFYRSADGRFIIDIAEQNQSDTHSLEDVRRNEDMSISREAMEADKLAMREALRASEHMERIETIGQHLAGSQWFAPFATLRPDMHTLELALQNDDFTQAEEAEFDRALESALSAHLDKCYAE